MLLVYYNLRRIFYISCVVCVVLKGVVREVIYFGYNESIICMKLEKIFFYEFKGIDF